MGFKGWLKVDMVDWYLLGIFVELMIEVFLVVYFFIVMVDKFKYMLFYGMELYDLGGDDNLGVLS